MVAVHFITIPCEPNKANGQIERHILFVFLRNIVYARFEIFTTFL